MVNIVHRTEYGVKRKNGLRPVDESFRIPAAYDSQRRTDWIQSLQRDQSCPFADRQEGRPKLGPNLRIASQGRDSRVREGRIQISPSFCRTDKRKGQVVNLGGRDKRAINRCRPQRNHVLGARRFERCSAAFARVQPSEAPEMQRSRKGEHVPAPVSVQLSGDQ